MPERPRPAEAHRELARWDRGNGVSSAVWSRSFSARLVALRVAPLRSGRVARSVAELLPRPFSELTLADVGQIIADIGEERETLFFERKMTVNGNALAKACSAFANTYGGLLVVGVADADDALVGIEPLATEPQLWVKDTLRGLVLPMPSFRARWLNTDGGRGILVVLVEESTSTPHLLTRSGAIYVRNPGSSDPVPLADQRRLLDLTARGERAALDATANAPKLLGLRLQENVEPPTEVLALVATGVTADFEARLFSPTTPEYLSLTTWGEVPNQRAEHRSAVWAQHSVGVTRLRRVMYPIDPDFVGGVSVSRDGGVVVYRGRSPEGGRVRDDLDAMEGELRANFDDALRAAREVLGEFGAHGDLRLAYQVSVGGGHIHFDSVPMVGMRQIDGAPIVETWTSFEDATVTDRVFAELLRFAGLGPRAD